jgi:osmoprotectant transport system ATP-binding protein
MSAAFVEFDRVGFTIPGAGRILDDFSLAIAEGETVALLGRSGSGKTTALRLVNALLVPGTGEVRVAGRATTAWNPIELRRRSGYVIQEVGLFPHRSVARNVATVPELERWEASRIAARTNEMLELVGLEPARFAGRQPHELSGGQRQRVGVARALAADPPLLLLDEPFGALDPITRRELQDEFRALTRRLGKTAIFVTHDLSEAARVADRIALLDGGRLVALGSFDELRRQAGTEVRAFFASSAVPGDGTASGAAECAETGSLPEATS